MNSLFEPKGKSIRSLRVHTLRTTLIGLAVGSFLNGAVLITQSLRDELTSTSFWIGVIALQGFALLAFLQRRLEYERCAQLLLGYLLIVCTYFQSFRGLTPGTALGNVTFLMLCSLFFGARGVIVGTALTAAALCVPAGLLLGRFVQPWPEAFWDPHEPLVWVRYTIVLVCYGGVVSASFATMIEGLDQVMKHLSDTLRNERWERTQREAAQRALETSKRFEALGHFAAGMAHDFNNSLAVIAASANMIRAEPALSSEVMALTNDIIERAQLGAGTVRQLMQLGRNEPGPTLPVRFEAILRRSLSTLRDALTERVELRFESTSNAVVVIDGTRLQQALLNLALNARDAMPTGGNWLLVVRDHQLSIVPPGWSTQPGSFVSLECVDNGIGFDPQLTERIFEPFFTTKDPGKGTGLGLAMVRKTIQDASGFIEVESEPGRGTTFRLFIPTQPEALLSTQAQPMAATPADFGQPPS